MGAAMPHASPLGFFWGYLLTTTAFFILAIKSGQDSRWHAFIPIMNLWMLTEMAGLPLWWILLLMIPYVDIIVAAWVFMKIFERNGQPQFMGLLMLVPFANIVVAFGSGPPRR